MTRLGARINRLARVACMLAVTLMAVIALAGCACAGKPATTEGLLLHYAAAPDNDDFVAKGTVDVGVSMLGIHAKVPVSFSISTGGGTAHGTITADLDALDSDTYVAEIYVEQQDDALVVYLGTPSTSGTEWRHWTIDAKINVLALSNILSDAEFSRIAVDYDPQVYYDLTIPTISFYESAPDAVGNPDLFEGLDDQDVQNALGSDKVRFGFTESCLPRTVATGMIFDYKGELSHGISVTIQIDASATFDDYGSVDPSSVAVPASVRAASIATNEPFDFTSVLSADSPLAKKIASSS